MLGETEDEYRRLLYVAMTRAADRLIVGGCMPGNMNTVRKCCWYDLIVKGLGHSGLADADHRDAGWSDQALYAASRMARRPDGAAAIPAPTPPIALPAWLRGRRAAAGAAAGTAASFRSG